MAFTPSKSPMADPVLHLAQAHTRFVLGCDRAPTCPKLEIGGRPAPWVLGLGEVTVICEPWSAVRRLHRRKRGFSAAVSRFRDLLALPTNTERVRVEVWADGEEDLDPVLLEKMGRQLETPIIPVGLHELPGALAAVRNSITADWVADPNPLVAVLAWMVAVGDVTPTI